MNKNRLIADLKIEFGKDKTLNLKRILKYISEYPEPELDHRNMAACIQKPRPDKVSKTNKTTDKELKLGVKVRTQSESSQSDSPYV
jgi:hypothetical protein